MIPKVPPHFTLGSRGTGLIAASRRASVPPHDELINRTVGGGFGVATLAGRWVGRGCTGTGDDGLATLDAFAVAFVFSTLFFGTATDFTATDFTAAVAAAVGSATDFTAEFATGGFCPIVFCISFVLFFVPASS